jgi:hypothetical protein
MYLEEGVRKVLLISSLSPQRLTYQYVGRQCSLHFSSSLLYFIIFKWETKGPKQRPNSQLSKSLLLSSILRMKRLSQMRTAQCDISRRSTWSRRIYALKEARKIRVLEEKSSRLL